MNTEISRIRIATRKSKLALWQARHVQRALEKRHPGLDVELVPMTTRGDQMLGTALSRIGGKGLFLKELENALLDGRADIAVHSMKDIPAQIAEGLTVPVILERGDALDAFVSNYYGHASELPDNACVGTASMRRQCQLLARFPGFRVETLRGNVQTRLRKLDEGRYDAIILASAGLKRLELQDRITYRMPPDESLPAIGQGAIGIECRSQDTDLIELIKPLHHRETGLCLAAERAFNARLEGSCQVPLAGYAELDDDRISLKVLLGSPDGRRVIRKTARGHAADGPALGHALAGEILADGGDEILRELERLEAEH